MDFDCDYTVQQVVPRTREEKVLNRDRDGIEKSRLTARVEGHRRYPPVEEMTIMTIVKAPAGSTSTIDDVDRFNRDYTQDQRTTKHLAHELMLARANARRSQQALYRQGVEEQRRQEAAQAAKVLSHVGQHDFLKESVLYDPVTCVVPRDTENGAAQRRLDSQRETFREARALRIQHSQNSTPFNPITGETRPFW